MPTISAPLGDGQDVVAHFRSGRYTYGGCIARTAQFTAADIYAATATYARLAFGMDLVRKRVASAHEVPVPNMETQRDDVGIVRQLAEKFIRFRTGRAALRGEEFDDRESRFGLDGRR